MPPAVSILEGMLLLDPETRLTAKQGLSHPFLAEYHDPESEPDSEPYDDSFESMELAVGEWKSKLFSCLCFRSEISEDSVLIHISFSSFTGHLNYCLLSFLSNQVLSTWRSWPLTLTTPVRQPCETGRSRAPNDWWRYQRRRPTTLSDWAKQTWKNIKFTLPSLIFDAPRRVAWLGMVA